MAAIETQALVLEAREYRETSLLVTLLTPGHGRLGGVAKGARRAKSGLAGVLQPFSLIAARLSMRSESGGGLASIASAELMEHPDYIRPGGGEDALARMAYAGIYAEVLAQTEENDPHSAELFDLARYFLLGLAAAPHPGSFAVYGYFSLLAALGYAPSLEMVPTGKASTAPAGIQGLGPIGEAKTKSRVLHINVAQGVLRPSLSHSGPGDFALSADAFDALRRVIDLVMEKSGAGISKEHASSAGQFTLSKRVGPTLVRLAIRLFETRLEHILRSARFLEEMVLSPGR